MRRLAVVATLIGCSTLAGCRDSQPAAPAPPSPVAKAEPKTTPQVTSSANEPGAAIPKKYSCQGQDTAPPLAWTAGPEGTKTYAVVLDDPDAPGGTWVHWLVWNLKETQLDEGSKLPDGAATGLNSWDKPGYGGPCPPRGRHRYCFKVYALSAPLTLPAKAKVGELTAAMQGQILAQGELLGTYQKD